MKRIVTLAVMAILATGVAVAQQPAHQCSHHGQGGQHCGRHQQAAQAKPQPAPLQYNADGIETTIVKAFPEAKKVKKADKWTEVYNAKGKLVGYAVYSKPASNSIKGYAGETPVMIALSKKQVITGVYPMPNIETPGYAKRVEDAGFYKNWNGLNVKQAKQKKVDAVSGATFTSRAVAQSVEAALKSL